MRKLTILLAATALVAAPGCGPCRSLCRRGSPCGTTMAAPAMLSAPLAFSAPQAQPNMCIQQAPMCVPCDPCMQYDPCANTGISTGVSSGYFGGYLPSGSDCNCDPGAGAVISSPSTVGIGGTAFPAPATP